MSCNTCLKVICEHELETFYRGEELGCQQRSLPGRTYNTLKLLLESADKGCVFVPIRSMQYLAVIDRQEVIFVDGVAGRRFIEFSWCEFRPQSRSSLSEAVAYKLVYYDNKALVIINQVQVEFDKVIQALYAKSKDHLTGAVAEVLSMPKR